MNLEKSRRIKVVWDSHRVRNLMETRSVTMAGHGYRWDSSVWDGNIWVKLKLNIRRSLVNTSRISLVGMVFCSSAELRQKPKNISFTGLAKQSGTRIQDVKEQLEQAELNFDAWIYVVVLFSTLNLSARFIQVWKFRMRSYGRIPKVSR